MRAVVQRVSRASVRVNDQIVGQIGPGLLVLLGVSTTDTLKDADYLAEKIVGLRIFDDSDGKMNLPLTDLNGEILAVSQFTLFGDCRKGKRPGFVQAAPAEMANRLYQAFIESCRAGGVRVSEGVFQAEMAVELVNDGPVTILLDSQKTF